MKLHTLSEDDFDKLPEKEKRAVKLAEKFNIENIKPEEQDAIEQEYYADDE